MSTTTVMRAADFLGTLGVNTHVPYTDGGYVNIAHVEADLAYLGITQVRDSLSDGVAGAAPLSSFIALAEQGITFDVISFVGGDHTTAEVAGSLVLAEALDAAVPGSVSAIEGANEVNNFTLTYNGVGGIAGAVALQQALYAAVKADPLLPDVSVYYFTGYDAGTVGTGPNPATTPGLADADSQHPYPNNGDAPLAWVNRAQALGNEAPATGAAVYTETGYSTNGGTSGAVNADVQAKYTLDLLMDDAKAGISVTYLYQLMDAYQAGSPQGDDGFGLFDTNNQPKEAATAIHDLTAILADGGAGASTFAVQPLAYALTNLPSTGDSLELQKSSGATDIVVWAEPAIWDESTGTERAAPVVHTTLALGATYATVAVFDPLLSASPIETLADVSSVTLAVTDHPLIVEVGARTVTATSPASGAGTSSTGTGSTGTSSTTTSSATATATATATAAVGGAGGGTGSSTAAASAATSPADPTATGSTAATGAGTTAVLVFDFPGATATAAAAAQAQFAQFFAGGATATALVLSTGGSQTLSPGTAAVLDEASGDHLAAQGGITAFLQQDTAFAAGTGDSIVYAAGADTISAGSGALTVAGGAAALHVFGGSGALTLIGGAGAVSATGGTGTTILTGSTGTADSLLEGGSGTNTLTGGSGASTLVGGNNVTEFAHGSGPTMMVAGTGTSIMNGTTGTGSETVFTAGGTALIALNNAADTVVGGSGAATVIGGQGPTVFAFLKGHAEGREQIMGFSASDNLAFGGFDGWAIASEAVVNGSDVMRLTDGTEITFLGLAHTLFRA